MKRILIAGSYAGSLVNFRGPLIRDMVAAGHKVIVAAPDITPDLRATLDNLGAQVEETEMARTGLNPLKDFAYFWTLKKLFKRVRPDLVLSYTIKPNIWCAMAAHSYAIPSFAMVTGLGYAFTGEGNLRQKFVRRLATRLYRMATNRNRLVIFQNKDDRDDFVKAGCLGDLEKVRYVNGSGVDMDFYTRQALPDAPVFLMISRLLGNKGVREFGKASVIAKERNPNACFQLAGYMDEGPDGIDPAELQEWIDGGVEFLGPLNDVRPAMGACSVYVLPSYREGTPRSVLEALAVGRAVITSDAPGCRETVVDGHNGFLVDVGDVAAVADRMQRLINDPDLRSKMAERSYELAKNKYEVGAVNRTLMQHLSLIGCGAEPLRSTD